MAHFTRKYAQLYDSMYGDKNYEAEGSLLDAVISTLKPRSKTILDYGCGTGNHIQTFVQRGFRVYACDVNHEMLEIAKSKFSHTNQIVFIHSSERESIPFNSIDVCVCLFDVVSYMNNNNDILDFLRFAKKVLTKRGLLVFDFWYGPGVLHLRPEKRWKEFQAGENRVLRLTNPEHDEHCCIIRIGYKVYLFHDKVLEQTFDEQHSMRYFFMPEVTLLLEQAGFEVKKFGTWKNIDNQPSVNDWSALVVAQSV